VNGKEVAHFDADDVLGIRLTRGVIRERRAELQADPRVELRPSSSSDWLEVRIGKAADIEFVAGLVELAAGQHRPAEGEPAKLPPTGPDLERRRRFH